MTVSPVPWVYSREGGDRHIRTADGGSLFCDTDYYPWCSQNEADWPLIAAAPDLLARLKTRRANCVCDTDGSGYNLPAGRAICDECQADAVAIAKAEGK